MRISVFCLLLAVGCGTPSIQERGWLGGEYETYRPHVSIAGFDFNVDCPDETELAAGALPCGAVAKAVYPGTPAFLAGLKPGDLVHKVAGDPIQSSEELSVCVRSAAPGQSIPLSIWRNGKDLEVSVVLGVERYERHSRFEFATLPNPKLKLIPTPDYNWLGISFLRHSRTVPELLNPVEALRATDGNYGEPEGNAWAFFFYPIGFGAFDVILKQELESSKVSAEEDR